MRIAMFSDVHGNLTALKAVLADIALQGVDQTIFAGDLCLMGPRPGQCLHEIQKAKVFCVYGNTEDWILRRQSAPERLGDIVQWTFGQLNDSQRSWLARLPFSLCISPTAGGENDLIVVHANPLDVNQTIFPSEQKQMDIYNHIRQEDEALEPLLAKLTGKVLAFGHLHIPGERDWKELRLVNISSVSIPGDADPLAKYGIFTWLDGGWHFERHRVDFDISKEIDAYHQAKPPGWENIVEIIEREGFFAQGI